MNCERAEIFNLEFPPIVEVVVDIDCEMPPSVQLANLEEVAASSLKDKYPQIQKRTLQQFEILQDADSGSQHHVSEGVLDALLFRSHDGRQLTQFRSAGYSFNRLAPYAGMDVYLPEIRETWETIVG